ncbi:MAG TPA: hypothetical protein DCE29_01985 [Alteromonas macleodii]|nr:hypothetical protein BBP29_01715 [Alteromonas macleodii]HAA96634.1 hypothetical protein [Alteromonas macleodii]HAM16901.1 hypothetical protein [Alteromonas macleodii]|tara:strand:+ start:5715 stop:5930 length:216 start_codon:yes stop_codon:yes gene_type:complete
MEVFSATLGVDSVTFSMFLTWLLTAIAVIFSVMCLIGMYHEVIEGDMDWADALIRVVILVASITFLSVVYL